MIDIVPAILPREFHDIEWQAAAMRGVVPRVQVDIVDGELAPSRTWPYVNDGEQDMFGKLTRQERGLPEWDALEFELDMMVANPAEIASDWLTAGFSTLIPHREAADDEALAFIQRLVRGKGAGFGIAMLPSTPASLVERWVRDVDFIQVMGSDTIGKQGTPLSDLAVALVEDLHRRFPDLVIAVDIGVTKETIPRLAAAGVRKFVTGSAIWNMRDYARAVRELQALA